MLATPGRPMQDNRRRHAQGNWWGSNQQSAKRQIEREGRLHPDVNNGIEGPARLDGLNDTRSD
jgi:hypothetical protein